MSLLESVIEVNEAQPRKVVALLEKHWADLMGIRVAVLGLAFKPGTNDVRESPAFPILRELLKRGAVLKAFDPVAMDEARRRHPRRRYHLLREPVGGTARYRCPYRGHPLAGVPRSSSAYPGPPPRACVCRRTACLSAGSVERYEGIGL